jgi:hypothetical protein
LITLLWVLITERNVVNADEKKKNPNRLDVELQSFCNEYLEFFNKEHISAPHVNETLSKPSPRYLKINIDGFTGRM